MIVSYTRIKLPFLKWRTLLGKFSKLRYSLPHVFLKNGGMLFKLLMNLSAIN